MSHESARLNGACRVREFEGKIATDNLSSSSPHQCEASTSPPPDPLDGIRDDAQGPSMLKPLRFVFSVYLLVNAVLCFGQALFYA